MLTQAQSHAFAQCPRAVPWRVRTQLLFGGAGQILWIFLGVLLFSTFRMLQGVGPIRLAPPKTLTVLGTVRMVQEILPPPQVRNDPRYANHPKLYDYTFSFHTADGQTITCKDFATGYHPTIGETVTVLYQSDNPQSADGTFLGREVKMPTHEVGRNPEVEAEIARQRTPMGILSRQWPLLLPLGVMLLLWLCIRHGARHIALLRNGKFAWGTLAAATTIQTDGNTSHQLAFTFTGDDGHLYNVKEAITTEAEWHKGEEYPVLYDAANPHRAIALCTESNIPFTITDRGALEAKPGSGLIVLVLPLGVGLGLALYLYKLACLLFLGV